MLSCTHDLLLAHISNRCFIRYRIIYYIIYTIWKMKRKQRYTTEQNEKYLERVAKHLGVNISQAQRMVLTRAEQLKIML